jgi:hypothetical protein
VIEDLLAEVRDAAGQLARMEQQGVGRWAARTSEEVHDAETSVGRLDDEELIYVLLGLLQFVSDPAADTGKVALGARCAFTELSERCAMATVSAEAWINGWKQYVEDCDKPDLELIDGGDDA